jgi:N-acetylneuraminic acid mutarotase
MNPMHESRAVPCAVETRVGARAVLVVVGGSERSEGVFVDSRRTTEVFDLASDRWRLLDVLLPMVRSSLGCAVQADGTVLAIGGVSHMGPTFFSLANVDALSITSRDLQ